MPKSIRHGDKVKLIKAGSLAHTRNGVTGFIPLGTQGTVIALRDHDGKRQYLVKFDGHGGNRHCNEDEIDKSQLKGGETHQSDQSL